MQKKLIIAVLLNVIIISATLGVVSYYAVHESIQRSLESRLALARIISNYVEVFLNNNFLINLMKNMTHFLLEVCLQLTLQGIMKREAIITSPTVKLRVTLKRMIW